MPAAPLSQHTKHWCTQTVSMVQWPPNPRHNLPIHKRTAWILWGGERAWQTPKGEALERVTVRIYIWPQVESRSLKLKTSMILRNSSTVCVCVYVRVFLSCVHVQLRIPRNSVHVELLHTSCCQRSEPAQEVLCFHAADRMIVEVGGLWKMSL